MTYLVLESAAEAFGSLGSTWSLLPGSKSSHPGSLAEIYPLATWKMLLCFLKSAKDLVVVDSANPLD